MRRRALLAGLIGFGVLGRAGDVNAQNTPPKYNDQAGHFKLYRGPAVVSAPPDGSVIGSTHSFAVRIDPKLEIGKLFGTTYRIDDDGKIFRIRSSSFREGDEPNLFIWGASNFNEDSRGKFGLMGLHYVELNGDKFVERPLAMLLIRFDTKE